MRALAAPAYGPLESLTLIDLPTPEPEAGQVRVKVVASALNPADYKSVTGELKIVHHWSHPMVVGYDFSGRVDALGAGVTAFAKGDEVFGFLPYGFGTRRGAFAEYVIAATDAITRKPAGVSHELAAAAATAGLTALQCLRDVGRLPASGGRVYVNGASGGVGSLAIGIAHKLGATVVAVCSTPGEGLVRELGADDVIDRKKVDPILTAKGPFDVVLDAAAVTSWTQARALLKPGGAYVTTLPTPTFFLDKLRSAFAPTRAGFITVKARAADFELLGKWLAEGLKVPIDSTVKIKDVAAGLRRLRAGEMKGRIAVDVAGGFS